MLMGQSGRLLRAAPRFIRPRPPAAIYVNTGAAGGGDGLKDTPYNNLSDALKRVDGFQGGVIRLKTPTDALTVRVQTDYTSAFDVTIEPWEDEDDYKMYGSAQHTSGWADQGGGVWSKSLGYTLIGPIVVPTMTETVGDVSTWFLKLLPNVATPTTPAAGEYGYTGGTAYVHLPDGEVPNDHTLEVPRINFSLFTNGAGKLTAKKGIFRYHVVAGTMVGQSTQPDGSGYMDLYDCLHQYGENGPSSTGKFELLRCFRCVSQRHANDGYNIHAPVPGGAATLAELFDCDGSYNGDVQNASAQGCSAHEACTLDVYGGTYNYNVSGGQVSIDDAEVNLIADDPEWGAIMIENNMRLGNVGGTIQSQAACAWMDNCSGSVTGPVYVRNNQGIGVKVEDGTVTGLENIVSTGNGAPDQT